VYGKTRDGKISKGLHFVFMGIRFGRYLGSCLFFNRPKQDFNNVLSPYTSNAVPLRSSLAMMYLLN